MVVASIPAMSLQRGVGAGRPRKLSILRPTYPMVFAVPLLFIEPIVFVLKK